MILGHAWFPAVCIQTCKPPAVPSRVQSSSSLLKTVRDTATYLWTESRGYIAAAAADPTMCSNEETFAVRSLYAKCQDWTGDIYLRRDTFNLASPQYCELKAGAGCCCSETWHCSCCIVRIIFLRDVKRLGCDSETMFSLHTSLLKYFATECSEVSKQHL